MSELIALLFGLLIGGGGVYLFMSRKSCPVCETSKIGTHVEKQQKEKQARKERILEMLQEKGSITNDDIEQPLGISHPTAANYLHELVEEGKIEMIGEHGRFVSYKLKNHND